MAGPSYVGCNDNYVFIPTGFEAFSNKINFLKIASDGTTTGDYSSNAGGSTVLVHMKAGLGCKWVFGGSLSSVSKLGTWTTDAYAELFEIVQKKRQEVPSA